GTPDIVRAPRAANLDRTGGVIDIDFHAMRAERVHAEIGKRKLPERRPFWIEARTVEHESMRRRKRSAGLEQRAQRNFLEGHGHARHPRHTDDAARPQLEVL